MAVNGKKSKAKKLQMMAMMEMVMMIYENDSKGKAKTHCGFLNVCWYCFGVCKTNLRNGDGNKQW